MDDYKFLQRSKNIIFLCDGCIPAAKSNMCEKSTSLLEELVELKTSVEEVKAAICAMSQSSAPNPEAKYSSAVNSVKYLSEYETEIRVSGIPESEIEKDLNGSCAQNHTRKKIFDDEEANTLGVIENLVLSSVGVSGFRRLGKFDPTRLEPRQKLVKFSDSYTVEKILARSSMLKLYEPSYTNLLFFNKQKLLKKRREILNNDNADPKSVQNQVIDLDE